MHVASSLGFEQNPGKGLMRELCACSRHVLHEEGSVTHVLRDDHAQNKAVTHGRSAGQPPNRQERP